MLAAFSIVLLSAWLPVSAAAAEAERQDVQTTNDARPAERVLRHPVELRLVWIPDGSFRMGDVVGSGQADERPLRDVEVAGFWMMRTEVTRSMFARFVAATAHDAGDHCWVFDGGWVERSGINWETPGFAQADDHPVTCISWYDAKAFIAWLNSEAGETFRLPSEAEWEYAARAGTDSLYYMGNDRADLCSHANAADQSALKDYPEFDVNSCDDGYVRTSPVASFTANPWGLHDVYGNVWEWVEDCWNVSYDNGSTDGSPMLDGDCDRRGFRGGGYGDIPHFARSTLRNRGDATHRKDDIGMRLVSSGSK